jgi:type IV secretion system protein VirD4
VRVAFACNDERTARRISDMLGVTTETRAQMNYAGSRMAPWLGHTMVSRQEVPRPLLTPGEVMQLPHADALILTGGAPPIRAKKVRYFAEPIFKARLKPPIASPRHSPNGLPTAWSGLIASTTPLPPSSQSTSLKRASGPGHTHAQDQSEQSLQHAFNFSTPAAGEATQTNDAASQATPPSSDDLGAAFTGPGLARTVFAFNPEHFDTDV